MPVDPIDIAAVAARALGRLVRSADIVSRTPLAYDPFLAGRSVERVSGTAVLSTGATSAWAAIVKRTDGGDVRAARRELAAYRTGIAQRAGPGLGAPALLAATDGDAAVELWLEELRDAYQGAWPLDRYAVAAGHIAMWDAAMRGRVVAGVDLEDAWAERHGQPHRLDTALADLDTMRHDPAAGDAAAALGDSGFLRTAALIESTPRRIDRLHRLPKSLLHHDLVRSNLFAPGDESTIAIDWETIGPGPLGVDLAPLVVGSVRRGEASGDDLEELERIVLEAYTAGLAARGIHEEPAVREAYRFALGLRWHVVLGTIRNLLDTTATRVRGSRPAEPREESLRHMAILARHLLAASEG